MAVGTGRIGGSRRVAVVVASCVALVAGFVMLVPLPAHAATYRPPSSRQRVDLNASWRFVRTDVPGAQAPGFDDSAWTPVTVPHTWNARDGEDGGNNYYRGVGWYRRHYTPPATPSRKKTWLDLSGADTVTDVWANGTYLGQHRGGDARVRVDATAAPQLRVDNVIAVKGDNAPDPPRAPP